MDNPIPAELRSKHLFLLVGRNPLPNWVAAQLLIDGKGTAHLIHSEGTKPYADRLAAMLRECGISAEYVPVSESNADQIFVTVQAQAQSKGRVGLNYTGGTKVMAVHAHRAIHATPNSVLSYLDARTMRMRFDGRSSEGYYVGLSCSAQLNKVLSLHDNYTGSDSVQYETDPRGIPAAQELVRLHGTYDGQVAWRKYCSAELRVVETKGVFHKRDLYRRAVAASASLRLPNPSEFRKYIGKPGKKPLPDKVKENIVSIYQAFLTAIAPAGGTGFPSIANNHGFGDEFQVARWLHGTWLEHYTASQLSNSAPETGIDVNSVALSLMTMSDEKRRFEVDVVAFRGYQLLCVSCYTGHDLGTAKLKVFEAIARATQMGGQEALVALVSCVDDPKQLRREAEADWQDQGRVAVFGRRDLHDLGRHIARWLGDKPGGVL